MLRLFFCALSDLYDAGVLDLIQSRRISLGAAKTTIFLRAEAESPERWSAFFERSLCLPRISDQRSGTTMGGTGIVDSKPP